MPERRHPRYPTDIVVRVAAAPTAEPVACTIRNIGFGGVFIEMPEPSPIGSILTLHFQLPGAPFNIHCRGRVVWRTGGDATYRGMLGVGVHLTEISLQDMRQLAVYLAELEYNLSFVGRGGSEP